MADVLKHKFVSAVPNSGDATIVRPSNWNEEHAFATGSDGQPLLRDSAQTDGARFGTLGAGFGGTGLTSYAVGDLIFASAATTLSKLAAVSAGQVLVSGGVATAPAWSAILTLTAGAVTVADATNFVLGTTTGTKFGTATTQKLGFYNATPIAQGASIADPAGGATVDAEARTAIIALISRLEALGLIATV